MGREIVYCEGCGHNLREDDFEKGRARTIDNKPFCTECRPYAPGEPGQPRRPSSGKVPAGQPRKSASQPIPVIAPARRSATGPAATNPLPVIAAIGGVLFLVLIFAITQSGTRKATTPETAPLPPVVISPPRRAEPAPPPPPPPPPPPRVAQPPAPPTGPLVAPSASEKLDSFLAQIRSIIDNDPQIQRSDEILKMFAAAEKVAGPRAAEVMKMRSDYVDRLDEPTRRAAAWGEWHITSNGDGGMTVLLPSHADRSNVYQTHPIDKSTPAALEREVDVPAGKKTTFSFWVACHTGGDFELRVYVDKKQILKEIVGPPGSGWREKKIDLTPYAGKRILLRLENFPNDWLWEFAYWSDFAIKSD
ncbi:MAG TPA: hypothetical protein VE981_08980 [Planctomycetota bacterium]|nr:hypothetical protein [Planctomycetota bacterium]